MILPVNLTGNKLNDGILLRSKPHARGNQLRKRQAETMQPRRAWMRSSRCHQSSISRHFSLQKFTVADVCD